MRWSGGSWPSAKVRGAPSLVGQMSLGLSEGCLAISPSKSILYGPARLLWFDPSQRNGSGLEEELLARATNRPRSQTAIGVVPRLGDSQYTLFWAEEDGVTNYPIAWFNTREAAFEFRDGLCEALTTISTPLEMVERSGVLGLRLCEFVRGAWTTYFNQACAAWGSTLNFFLNLRGLTRCQGVFDVRTTFQARGSREVLQPPGRSRYDREVEIG